MLGSWLKRRAMPPITTMKYQRTPRIAATQQAITTVLTDGAQFFTLNESSSRIWELLKKPRTSEEIARVIAEEYDAPDQAVQRDTEQLLSELTRLKLVRTVVEPSALR